LHEDANLIVTRKSRRFKYHYLNAVPLQDVMDCWVAPFLQPQAKALSDLKFKLKKDSKMSEPDFIMQTFIRCSQDALWTALMQADDVARYHFACNVLQANATVGQATDFIKPDDGAMLR
jgi:hypothetical protein